MLWLGSRQDKVGGYDMQPIGCAFLLDIAACVEEKALRAFCMQAGVVNDILDKIVQPIEQRVPLSHGVMQLA